MDLYASDIKRVLGKLDSGAWKVSGLRNLVHGVAAEDQGDRYRRLRLLRDIGRNKFAVQVVIEIAALWWTAVLLDPARFSPNGPPPWKVAP